MQNTLPVPPVQQAMPTSSPSAPASPKMAPKEAPKTEEEKEEKVDPIQEYMASLSEPAKAMYMAIKKDLESKQKISILMVSGELTYIYDLKGLPIEFKLLNGKEKYNVDQYQYGKDPFGIFKEEDDKEIQQRMEDFNEEKREAAIAFLERQSLDAVSKRTTLVTLALAITSFNGKHLGDVKSAVSKIENFQAPIIEKLAAVYNMFETVAIHMLQDDDLIKK